MKKKTVAVVLSVLVVLTGCMSGPSSVVALSTDLSIPNQSMDSNDEDTFDEELLMDLILSNDQGAVLEMIQEEGYDPNYQFEDGRVYFENVLVFMNLEMAQILFDSGVDPYLVTSNGKTIAQLIRDSCNKAMNRLLDEVLEH